MNNANKSSGLCKPTLKILADYWTMRIIDELQHGESRYCQLQRELDNLNPVTLTDRLKKMEEANLVYRLEETVDKVSVVYGLSELGREALPILRAVDRFAAKSKKYN